MIPHPKTLADRSHPRSPKADQTHEDAATSNRDHEPPHAILGRGRRRAASLDAVAAAVAVQTMTGDYFVTMAVLGWLLQ